MDFDNFSDYLKKDIDAKAVQRVLNVPTINKKKLLLRLRIPFLVLLVIIFAKKIA